ncbi:MAG: geranylgeranyl reductase family protein [Pseudomonadota bacterium]
MSQERTDLIVVGGGPAGAMAGFHAARRGLSVIILDKAAFPRRKPCAGGLTMKALLRLPFSIADVVEETTCSLDLGLNCAPLETVTAKGPVCAFVQRDRLDPLLLSAALDAGCRFHQIGKIDAVRDGSQTVDLMCGEQQFAAPHVIAADGANSAMRRLVQPRLKFRRGFAVEGLVTRSADHPAPPTTFEFGAAGQGYGWLFPKRDHINVGLYTVATDAKLSKTALRAYAARYFGTETVTDICGFPVGFGGRSYQTGSGRILFAGDAAGMAECFLGEGLHNALASGTEAGLAVAEVHGTPNTAGLRYAAQIRRIQKDLGYSDALALRFFYPLLHSLGVRALTWGPVKRGLMRGFAAGQTLPEIAGSALRRHHPAPRQPDWLT